MERQRNSAAKLAGMITFVSYFCPELQPNFDRFRLVIGRMNVDLKDLEGTGPLVARAATYTEAYRKDTADSCRRAVENFGESGTTIPGLLARKEAAAKDAAPKDGAPKNP